MSVINQPAHFTTFMSLIRWWGFALIYAVISMNHLVPQGFLFAVFGLLVLAYIHVEHVLWQRHLDRVAEAESKFTDAELQNLLQGN